MWTEWRMRWLAGKLGFHRLTGSEVILPEERYFPERYSRDPDARRTIFKRVCGYMKLDPDRYDLDILPDGSIEALSGSTINPTSPGSCWPNRSSPTPSGWWRRSPTNWLTTSSSEGV